MLSTYLEVSDLQNTGGSPSSDQSSPWAVCLPQHCDSYRHVASAMQTFIPLLARHSAYVHALGLPQHVTLCFVCSPLSMLRWQSAWHPKRTPGSSLLGQGSPSQALMHPAALDTPLSAQTGKVSQCSFDSCYASTTRLGCISCDSCKLPCIGTA